MRSDLPQFLQAGTEILPYNTTQSVKWLDALHVAEKSRADWIMDLFHEEVKGGLLFEIINLNN